MSTTSSLEGNYSLPSLDDLQYDDSTSSIFQNRPIRPMPKRRIRSRLSPEVADSILFPQRTTSTTSTAIQSTERDNKLYSKINGDAYAQNSSEERVVRGSESYQFRGSGVDERLVNGVRPRTPASGLSAGRNGYLATRHDDIRSYKQSHAPPPIPPSAASSAGSVDGYDSFENTNNKKKRKIPISGSLSNHQLSLSADMAHMDIASTRNADAISADPDSGVGQYYGSGSSAIAASSYGPGASNLSKGRSGIGRSSMRRLSGRSPLGVSFNGPNATLASRANLNSFNKEEQTTPEGSGKSNDIQKPPYQGIISAAIANAAALPSAPRGFGKETSVLEQHAFEKPSSTKTQFTFVCESDSAKSMNWPGYGYPSSGGAENGRPTTRGGGQVLSKAMRGMGLGVSTQGTQTSPSIADQPEQFAPASTNEQQAPPPPRNPRRSLNRQLEINAIKRKKTQLLENRRNPPKPDKVSFCDFCEYEMIYGEPPAALIKLYETKDRSEQKRLAEKRRLLEKAKMKNRKGKKGNKNKGQTATQPQQQQQGHNTRHDVPNAADDRTAMSPDSQSDDQQLLDEYDEDTWSPELQKQAEMNLAKGLPPTHQAHNHLVRPPAEIGIGSGGGPTIAA